MPIAHVRVSVAADAMTTLFSAPVTLIPAQGPDTIIVLLGAASQGQAASVNNPFAQNATMGFAAGDVQNQLIALASTPGAQGLGTFNTSSSWDTNPAANMPLLLTATSDIGPIGPIASITVTAGSGGALYAIGDTGTINPDGSSNDATYAVTSVDGSGAVTGLDLTAPGTQYFNGGGNSTGDGGAQPGVGTGLTVDIVVDAPTQTGAYDFDLFYTTIAPAVF